MKKKKKINGAPAAESRGAMQPRVEAKISSTSTTRLSTGGLCA